MQLIFVLFTLVGLSHASPSDQCLQPVEDPVHRSIGLKRCSDGATSFKQPPGVGINGYEGRCGQTAAANLTYFYCQQALHPVDDINRHFSDPSPGVLPRTLRDGLVDLFRSLPGCPDLGRWKRISFKDSVSFLKGVEEGLSAKVEEGHKLKRIRRDGSVVFTTPQAVLTAEGIYLHWITLIDIIKNENSCVIVYVDRGTQTEISCEALTQRALKVGKWQPILKPFTVIRFE